MRKILGLSLLALAACGDSPMEPVPSPAGTWLAQTETLTVELRLSGEGSLAGCVGFGFDPTFRPADRVFVSVYGQATGSDIQLEALPGQLIAWAFEGELGADDVLGGSMVGNRGTDGEVSFARVATEACPTMPGS